jgi:hypothetical protein
MWGNKIGIFVWKQNQTFGRETKAESLCGTNAEFLCGDKNRVFVWKQSFCVETKKTALCVEAKTDFFVARKIEFLYWQQGKFRVEARTEFLCGRQQGNFCVWKEETEFLCGNKN